MAQPSLAPSTAGALPRKAASRSSFQHMNEAGLLVIIVVLYAAFWYSARGFLTVNNQVTILRDAATIGIAAWGATLIIIAGEIDISVGPMVAFISVILAFMLKAAVPLPVALALALVLGAALGAFAGVLRAYFDVPSFVATLGLWSALRGMALLITNALPVSYPSSDFMDALADDIFRVPVSAWIMFILFALFSFMARKTAYGRSVYAIGGNAVAARLCGIKVNRIRVMLFVTAGLLAAVTGILLSARLGSGNAGAASGLEFDVIAAVVVGGTSLSGGRGSMLGSLLGVWVITLIGNGLVLLGINPFFQEVVRGAIIVAAVLANIMATRANARRRLKI